MHDIVAPRNSCITRRWVQYAGAISASLVIFTSGMHFVWVSASLPKLYANDSIIPLSVDEGSWVASMELFADLPGAPLGAFCADYFGRRRGLLLTGLPYFIGWVMIALATNVPTLLVAKFLVGVADGSTYTILPMFIGEIAEDDIRGKLGNCMTVMLDLGSLFLYSVAPWIPIRTMALIAMIIPVLFFATFWWIPETPYYLLMIKKRDKAKKSLQQYRGLANVDAEFEDMSNIVDCQMSETSNWSDLIKNKAYFKGMVIMFGLKTMQMMSGIFAVQVFAELIFSKAGGFFSGSISAIIFGAAQFLSGFFAMLIVDKVGRRPLLIISSIGCCIALTGQAVYFYIQFHEIMDLEAYGWVPVTALMIYIIMYSVGLGAIPLMVPSEMFPTNIKAKALCITDLYLAMLGFLIVQFYQIVANKYGSHVPFIIFALSCVFGVFFTIFIMPETKGKSLEDIQNMLRKTKEVKNLVEKPEKSKSPTSEASISQSSL
ncbi:facilitated trehalose transporter Tret1-like [Chrysoperla carnea]|uniref:facilitated trehalose transporter Tret1-like n=1 Tax=Chrysoperla carnea TaxID=189513 RepID=UPI001D075C01|nr:facilitated trehalose transporter Tret1-like [Chrysoperla carnea]